MVPPGIRGTRWEMSLIEDLTSFDDEVVNGDGRVSRDFFLFGE